MATMPTALNTCPCGARDHWTLSELRSRLKPMFAYPWDVSLAVSRSRFELTTDNQLRALTMREFLNSWTCRIPANTESTSIFTTSFTEWFSTIEPQLGTLPPLARLTDSDIEILANLFWRLSRRPAGIRRDGVLRSFGPTAASKAMMFVFSESCPAWDQQIRDRRTGGQGNRASYVRYLRWARLQAQCLEAQLVLLTDAPSTVPQFLNRGEASLAFIIDTAGYLSL